MSDQYRVLFRGDIVNGCSAEEVKLKLAKLLNEDGANIEKLFSGETFVIKKSPDLEKCEKIRRSFIAVGAVCHIKDPSPFSRNKDAGKDDSTLQIVEDSALPIKDKPTGKRVSLSFGWLSEQIASFGQRTRHSFRGLNQKSKKLWEEGSESIQSDMEIGGVGLLVKNKYCLGLSSGAVVIISLILFGLTYERKVMPLTEDNFNNLLNHITFIENAFTTEELENMTQNRSDFLDYLLVDPIKKMGYQFEPSLMEMAEEYLDEDLRPGEMKKVKIYLEIASHERSELLKHNIISADMKKQLDAVARKIAK